MSFQCSIKALATNTELYVIMLHNYKLRREFSDNESLNANYDMLI